MEQRHAPLAEGGQRLELYFPAELSELALLGAAVQAFGASAGWPPDLLMQADLVLEELVCNTISYGYPDGRAGRIAVCLDALPATLRIELQDDGDAFDPFSLAPPDLTQTLAERAIGGLGIHLVRSYMDSWDYAYRDGRNRVTLLKRYAPANG